MIPGATAAESLVGVLLRTARVLRDGGTVALKLQDIDDDCTIQTALASLGIGVRSTVFDLADGVLVAHTISRSQPCAMAS